jgi:membrane associated rhomboid family serine protease
MPRTPPVTVAILIANLFVFAAWYALPLPTMIENFLVSRAHLEAGRFWVVVTAVFSHNMLFHLMINMLVLWSFGGVLEHLLGPGRFLRFYLTAGIISSLSHVLTSTLLLGRPAESAALGASGAIAGLLLLFSLTFPKHRILIFGIIPAPALVAALAFIAIDLWGLVAQLDGGGLPIGHGAHLGGALVGAVYYFMLRKRYRERG